MADWLAQVPASSKAGGRIAIGPARPELAAAG